MLSENLLLHQADSCKCILLGYRQVARFSLLFCGLLLWVLNWMTRPSL